MNERIEHPRDYEAESRRHRILWIGGAVVAVLAIIVYFVATRDDGEENRAAYCSALSDMVGSDSLEQALKGANKAEVERITELSPRRRACLGQPVRGGPGRRPDGDGVAGGRGQAAGCARQDHRGRC